MMGRLGRHHRHQLGARLDILADAKRAVADGADDGRDNGGIGKIEIGLSLCRLVSGERGLSLAELRLQHVELPGRGLQRCPVARDRCASHSGARSSLLGILYAAVACRGELGVSRVVLLGEGAVRLVEADRRLRGLDDGLLRSERGLLGGDHRLGGRHIGLCLIERDPEIAIVDRGQNFAGLDLLVAAHEHSTDIARHLRRDGRIVRLDIGIVRRDLKAPDRPILPAEIAGARQGEEARADRKNCARPMSLGRGRRRNGLACRRTGRHRKPSRLSAELEVVPARRRRDRNCFRHGDRPFD
jgi:hypothetical protein